MRRLARAEGVLGMESCQEEKVGNDSVETFPKNFNTITVMSRPSMYTVALDTVNHQPQITPFQERHSIASNTSQAS